MIKPEAPFRGLYQDNTPEADPLLYQHETFYCEVSLQASHYSIVIVNDRDSQLKAKQTKKNHWVSQTRFENIIGLHFVYKLSQLPFILNTAI